MIRRKMNLADILIAPAARPAVVGGRRLDACTISQLTAIIVLSSRQMAGFNLRR